MDRSIRRGWIVVLSVTAFVAGMAVSPARAQVVTAEPGDAVVAGDTQSWPRLIPVGAETISVYQPQVEKWDGATIACRAAVAVQRTDGGEPVFGVVWISAGADVDKAARLVFLRDFQITRVRFPTAPAKDNQYLEILRRQLPTTVRTVALDRLEVSLAVSQAVKTQSRLEVENEPPRIIFTMTPAALVLIDGDAQFRAVPGTEAEQVLNTRALVLRVRGAYYLAAAGYWYGAASLDGPWTRAARVPAIAEQIKQQAAADRDVDLFETDAIDEPPVSPPTIYVSTVPAELIDSDGPPQLIPIEGTDLLHVQNSDDAIFLDLRSGQYHVLISGRWFRSRSIYGPWEYVPPKTLPADFAKIPPTHPRANVLVSVPGTPQAKEAVIASSVPQTATVQRNEAAVEVAYDGTPQFQTIEGTSMQYAVNTPVPVIYTAPRAYYCVQNGIWFAAPSPVGPWVVATSVPTAIYTIPPRCPVHYVTYVRIYGCTPQVVYVGYTPGYLGAVVTSDGVVVFGTGYRYRSHIGRVWIGRPCTYGFSVGFACGVDVGFAFGITYDLLHAGSHRPWWGPFQNRHDRDDDFGRHASFNHVNIYHQWDNRVVIRPREDGRRDSGHDRDKDRGRERFNPYSARPTSRDRDVRDHDSRDRWEANARPRVLPTLPLPPLPLPFLPPLPFSDRDRDTREDKTRDTRDVLRRGTDKGKAPDPEKVTNKERDGRSDKLIERERNLPVVKTSETPVVKPIEKDRTVTITREPVKPFLKAPEAKPETPAPKADVPVVKAPAPRVEVPATKPPAAKVEAPETKPPTPKVETPVVKAPAPKVETPVKVETPAVKAPDTRNDVFAGKDGQVYRRTATDEWEKRTDAGWQKATDSRTSRREVPDLKRESDARDVGEIRTRTTRSSDSAPAAGSDRSGESRNTDDSRAKGGRAADVRSVDTRTTDTPSVDTRSTGATRSDDSRSPDTRNGRGRTDSRDDNRSGDTNPSGRGTGRGR